MLRFTAARVILAKVFIIKKAICPCGNGRPVATIMQIGHNASPRLPKMIPNLTPNLLFSRLQNPEISCYVAARRIHLLTARSGKGQRRHPDFLWFDSKRYFESTATPHRSKNKSDAIVVSHHWFPLLQEAFRWQREPQSRWQTSGRYVSKLNWRSLAPNLVANMLLLFPTRLFTRVISIPSNVNTRRRRFPGSVILYNPFCIDPSPGWFVKIFILFYNSLSGKSRVSFWMFNKILLWQRSLSQESL